MASRFMPKWTRSRSIRCSFAARPCDVAPEGLADDGFEHTMKAPPAGEQGQVSVPRRHPLAPIEAALQFLVQILRAFAQPFGQGRFRAANRERGAGHGRDAGSGAPMEAVRITLNPGRLLVFSIVPPRRSTMALSIRVPNPLRVPDMPCP